MLFLSSAEMRPQLGLMSKCLQTSLTNYKDWNTIKSILYTLFLAKPRNLANA